MTKLVRIDELTYADLVHVSGEMMAYLGKPWSLGMSVRLAVVVLDEYMKTNYWKKLLKDLKKRQIPSPQKWMDMFETMHKAAISSDEGSAGP